MLIAVRCYDIGLVFKENYLILSYDNQKDRWHILQAIYEKFSNKTQMQFESLNIEFVKGILLLKYDY